MAALSLLAGVAMLLFISGLPSLGLLLALVAGSVLLLFKKSSLVMPKVYRCIAAFIIGFSWCSINAWQVRNSIIETEFEGKDITLTGIINSVPQLKTSTTKKGKIITRAKFRLLVESARAENGVSIDNLKTVQLSWYNLRDKITAGQRWNLKVRLKKPHGFANLGGFDYEKWLFSNRIGATGYVKIVKSNQLIDDSTLYGWDDMLRERVIKRLRDVLPSSDFNGIIIALATGHRSDISKTQWNGLLTSGTNHLVAISGLHIGLIAALAFFCARYAWGINLRVANKVAPIYVAASAAIIASFVYAALAGFSVPTQRALIMVVIVMGGILFKRHTTPEHILSVALVCVLLIEPLSVLMPGFWLSFAAVVIILFAIKVGGSKAGWRNSLRQWVVVQGFIALGLAPLTLIFFDRVSLVSPLVNLIAVPLFSFIVVPLVFLAMLLLAFIPTVAVFIFEIVQWVLEQFWYFIELTTKFDYATFSCSRLFSVAILLAAIAVILTLYFKKKRCLLLIPLSTLLISMSVDGLNNGEYRVDFLDVGQGSSMVIRTANHTLIYDAGPNRGLDAGDSVVVPYLAALGIAQIDKMVISHADNDHAGGAKTILDVVEVDELIVGENLKRVEHKSSLCRSGQGWEWDGVEFEFIYPFKKRKGNDASCVLLIRSVHGSVLLTGDIPKAAEKRILKRYKTRLLKRDVNFDIDIVAVPHHGSKGSSSEKFVNAIKPEYAVVSSGYRNRYKFPKLKVVKTYNEVGAEIVNTANAGMISFVISKDGVSQPTLYRQENRKVWVAVVPEEN